MSSVLTADRTRRRKSSSRRLRRPSKNFLEYQFTIDDPKVLTKPWTSAWITFSLSANDEDLFKSFCTNNENVGQLEKLNEVEKTKK